MIINSKTFFSGFFTTVTSANKSNLEVITMIIHSSNLDSGWKSLLHDSLSTAKTTSSVHTLVAELKILKIDSKKTKKLANNLIKAARQIGHLKTSKIEVINPLKTKYGYTI